MGYYNYPLRMLKRVRDAERAGLPFMSVGRAVQRLTSEIADYLAIDAGRLEVGRRADVAVVDLEGLNDDVERIEEAPMPGFPGLSRLVRRNDAAVRAVLVAGRLAWDGASATEGFGRERGFGTVLRAQVQHQHAEADRERGRPGREVQ
jgi:N-acyl-D-aspartate/D-glutamate deacylase